MIFIRMFYWFVFSSLTVNSMDYVYYWVYGFESFQNLLSCGKWLSPFPPFKLGIANSSLEDGRDVGDAVLIDDIIEVGGPYFDDADGGGELFFDFVDIDIIHFCLDFIDAADIMDDG
jgi:hypothetical protein